MIRTLKLEDASEMYQTLCDQKVNQYMNIDGKNSSVELCKDYIKKANQSLDCKHFAIVDEEDNWIGTISLKNIDHKVGQAEYAIITSSKVHGKGYAFNATFELLEYAFGVLKLNRVYLNVVADNLRANQFYKKCGFVLEGTFRKAIYIKNHIYDLNWYSMLRQDYLGVKKN